MDKLSAATSGINLGGYALTTLINAGVSLLLCLVGARLLLGLTDRMLGRAKRLDGTLRSFAHSAVKILLWVLTAIIVCNALGVPTASLVAMVSVVGLALSLSVQNILSNLFSGVTLLVNRPFAAGDFVELAGRKGVVQSLGLFYTRLSTVDNVAVCIPNSDVTSSAVVNYSSEPMRRVDLVFSAAYDEPTEKVRQAILDVIREDGRIAAEPAPFVRLSAFQNSVIDYTVRVWCKSADYWAVYFDLLERVRDSFERNGVQMSYDHVNVHIQKD